MRKGDALKKWVAEIQQNPNAVVWLDRNLKGKPQASTVENLERGIRDGCISIREALIWALVVGVQWNEKFDGVP